MSDAMQSLWDTETAAHMQVARDTFTGLYDDFVTMTDICTDSIQSGGTIFLFGNGGSAADAQHIATELTVRYKTDRAPIAAIALTTDTSALTAGGNDLGFDRIFARQLDALGRAGDVAIGISTSGNSDNVLNALRVAKDKDIRTIGLTGGSGGKMMNACDATLIVPSPVTARIQEMHITLGHMLCGVLEQRLGLVKA